jgi:hypothetical protein
MDSPFPCSYAVHLEKTCIFFPASRNCLPGRGNTLVEEERLRSASAPDGEETRLALAEAAVAGPREPQPDPGNTRPSLSPAQNLGPTLPPAQNLWAGFGAGDLISCDLFR